MNVGVELDPIPQRLPGVTHVVDIVFKILCCVFGTKQVVHAILGGWPLHRHVGELGNAMCPLRPEAGIASPYETLDNRTGPSFRTHTLAPYSSYAIVALQYG